MKFVDSYEARMELAVAVAKVIVTAEELKREMNNPERQFEILWKLANIELRNLESYRIP